MLRLGEYQGKILQPSSRSFIHILQISLQIQPAMFNLLSTPPLNGNYLHIIQLSLQIEYNINANIIDDPDAHYRLIARTVRHERRAIITKAIIVGT